MTSPNNQSFVKEGMKIAEKTEEDVNANETRPNLNTVKIDKKICKKLEFETESSVINTPAEEELWEPSNWRESLANMRKMNSNNEASIDSTGCHLNVEENVPPEVYRYQCLVFLMLSNQTTDPVSFAAMDHLIARDLTVDNILQMDDKELGELINPVTFWKSKVKHIKKNYTSTERSLQW